MSLALLAEYGAFEILRYQTFTTEIYTEFNDGFNPAAACGLALVLVLLGLAFLTADGFGRGHARTSRSGPLAARVRAPHKLGRATVPVVAGFSVLAVLALGVPLGALVYWLVHGGRTTLPAVASLSVGCRPQRRLQRRRRRRGHGGGPSRGPAVGPPSGPDHHGPRAQHLHRVGPARHRHRPRPHLFLRALRPSLYQHSPLLVLAYAILFFPLALVAVRASVAQAPVGLEEMARALGCNPWTVMWRVTFRLVAPGLAAAFCLVFLSAVTELTSTLILIPTGAATLATQFWAYTTGQSYAAAAPYATLMVAIAVIPSYLLGRWFNQLPTNATPPPT